MAQIMGKGLRYRLASSRDKSWVLSPISAKATDVIETAKTLTTYSLGRELLIPIAKHTLPPRFVLFAVGLAKFTALDKS